MLHLLLLGFSYSCLGLDFTMMKWVFVIFLWFLSRWELPEPSGAPCGSVLLQVEQEGLKSCLLSSWIGSYPCRDAFWSVFSCQMKKEIKKILLLCQCCWDANSFWTWKHIPGQHTSMFWLDLSFFFFNYYIYCLFLIIFYFSSHDSAKNKLAFV